MTMTRISPYLFAVGTTLALAAGLGYAQTNQHEYSNPAAAQSAPAERQAMMDRMQAEQNNLDDLVAQMNAAKGPEKVDRIAAVVTEMAAMHKRMNTMMMQRGMMMHMQRDSTPPAPPIPPQ